MPSWAKVRELGYLGKEEKQRYLDQSKIGVSILYPVPNYLEAYSVKIFEYMSAGLPVVATALPMYQSILDQYPVGLGVAENSPRAIADAINYLIDHPDKAKDMGKQGLEAIRKVYNWETESKKLLSFYEQILR